jgi:predicted lipase
MITHGLAVELLRVTMLVYDYGAKYEVKTNETLETFVSRLKSSGGIDVVSKLQKTVLDDAATQAPDGKVCKFISNAKTDVQAGITLSENNRRICVVFRGSESRTDWYYDLSISKCRLRDDIWVHSGFFKQLFDGGVYMEILEEVKRLVAENPDFEVYVTGHSLGAALSTLCGFELAHEIENPVTVVSFASPRVGNRKWKAAFDGKANLHHSRVSTQRDIVTAFPYFRYHHVGENIRLSDKAVKVFGADAVRSWYEETFLSCWSASDHMCDVYYRRLLQNEWLE